MIELPEAVVIAEQVNQTLKGKVIKAAIRGNTPSKFTFYSGTPEHYAAVMPGKKAGNAVADGSLIVIDLLHNTSSPLQLVLGGGGERILYHTSPATLPKKHQLLLTFADDTFLSVSVQGWGAAQLFSSTEASKRWCGFDKGLMPTEKGFTPKYFFQLFTSLPPNDRRSLKEFLVSKPGVRGVGNGYLQDILFRAKLHARVPATSLSQQQQQKLYKAIITTIGTAIKQHGRCDELDLFGTPGKYQRILSSATAGCPCPECKTPIEKEPFLGGSVYWCPKCQPKPTPSPPKRRPRPAAPRA